MGRVLTNNVNLAYSIETSIGEAGSVWYLLEPNTINSASTMVTARPQAVALTTSLGMSTPDELECEGSRSIVAWGSRSLGGSGYRLRI